MVDFLADRTLDRRLTALRATGLLDSRREGRFDRLTRVVAAALGVPVSMIALVDAERQFFKSDVGLVEPWKERRETPLTHSFCRHVVESEAALVVHDSRIHPLVSQNPAVEELGVAAYLGVPIADREGVVIGSLCAIDNAPRHWADADVDILTDVAALVQREIADRREADAMLVAERMVRGILNTMPQLVFATQADGTPEGFNNQWLAFTGANDDEDPPREWLDYVHDADRSAVAEAWRKALATEHVLEQEFRLRERDGAYHWMLVRAAPFRSETGAVERWFGSCTDIQALKDLRHANDKMRQDIADGLIERLSEKAAYAKGKEFDDIRGMIRSLRELSGLAR